jgi:hypothetical protein
VILPGGQRAKESELPGFPQGTTWVEFRRSLDEEDALHRPVCGIKCIPPERRPGATTILEGERADQGSDGKATDLYAVVIQDFSYQFARYQLPPLGLWSRSVEKAKTNCPTSANYP